MISEFIIPFRNLSLFVFSTLVMTVICNTPPRFVLDNAAALAGGGDIIIRLKEGQVS